MKFACLVYHEHKDTISEAELSAIVAECQDAAAWNEGIKKAGRHVHDYARRKEQLESDGNPFAPVVLAHLAALETRDDAHARRLTKIALLKRLYDRGLNADDVRQLIWIIDWMITLPAELEEGLRVELAQYEEERHMPYVSSFERLARQEGLRTGLLTGIGGGLKARFGAAGSKLMPRIRKVNDTERLRAILDTVLHAKSLAEVRESLE